VATVIQCNVTMHKLYTPSSDTPHTEDIFITGGVIINPGGGAVGVIINPGGGAVGVGSGESCTLIGQIWPYAKEREREARLPRGLRWLAAGFVGNMGTGASDAGPSIP
jgi:hypothetical protein